MTSTGSSETRMEIHDWETWRDAAVEEIRFRPDRDRVARELNAHYEDHCKDLERIGYDLQLAKERALHAMGDAKEVGQALDRAHTSVWNDVWSISRILLVMLVLRLALWVAMENDDALRAWQNLKEIAAAPAVYTELSPLLDPQAGEDGWTYLGEAVLPEAVEAGAYRITPAYGCWWQDTEGDDWLCLAVRTEDAAFPWTAPPPMFWRDCTVTDSQAYAVTTGDSRRIRGRYLHCLTIEMTGVCSGLEVCYDRGTVPLSLWIGKGDGYEA